MELDRNNVVARMLILIPEVTLTPSYEEEKKLWEEESSTSLHNFLGIVLGLYMVDLLRQKNASEDVLKRIFAFLEEISFSKDDYLINVLNVSLLEDLINNEPVVLEQALRYMEPNTKKMTYEMQEYLKKLAESAKKRVKNKP